MSQELTVEVPPGQEEEGESEDGGGRVLNVAVPLTFSARHRATENWTVEQSPDSHMIVPTPSSPRMVQHDGPDQPVFEDRPSQEGRAAGELGGREDDRVEGGVSDVPAPTVTSPDTNTDTSPVIQVL